MQILFGAVTPPPHTPSPFKGRGCALRFRCREMSGTKAQGLSARPCMPTMVGVVGLAPADGALI